MNFQSEVGEILDPKPLDHARGLDFAGDARKEAIVDVPVLIIEQWRVAEKRQYLGRNYVRDIRACLVLDIYLSRRYAARKGRTEMESGVRVVIKPRHSR